MRDDHPIPGADHIVDGVRLHVVHHGAGDGLPVLLLHGIPTSSYLWRDVQRDLEHRHLTIAPDLLGLGSSERPADGRYDLASQAQLLIGLLDELELERVAVVGHDVGGGVAVHLAGLAPDRVAALVLVDAPLHADAWPVPEIRALAAPGLGEVQGSLLRWLPAAGRRYVAWNLARGLRATTLSPKSLGLYAGPLLSHDGTRGLLALVRACDPSAVESAFDIVRKEPPPTLVLWADDDVWHGSSYGRRVAGDVPGASFVTVAGSGHFLPEDRPERVAEELEGFLADLPT